MRESTTSPIFPILLVNFIGTMGYSIVLPFLVVLVLKFGGNEIVYGILGATYSFFQLIGAPLLGNWSDKIGRRKVLLISQAGTFIAWILFMVALIIPEKTILQVESMYLGAFLLTLPLVFLFIARALDGITGGNVSVANAYLADVSTDETRKKNFGQMAVSGNLGFVIGPALAGILGATLLGDLLPVLIAMFISLIAIAVIAFRLKESNPCALSKDADPTHTRKILGMEHKECHKLTDQDRLSWAGILRLKNIPFLLVLYFLIFLAFNFFYVSFPIYALENLGWSIVHLGTFFSVVGGVMILFQGPVLAYLSKRYSDGALIIAGALLLAVSFVAFLYSSIWIIALGVLLFSAGNGIMWPSFLSLLSKLAGETYQGAVQGFASSAGSLASILGMLIGGLLFAGLGQAIFLIPAVLMGIIFLSSFRLYKMQEA